MAPGDVLLFYSDGLPEAWTRANEAFGYEQFEKTAARDLNGSAAAIRDRIVAEWRRSISDGPIADDISVAVVRRTP